VHILLKKPKTSQFEGKNAYKLAKIPKNGHSNHSPISVFWARSSARIRTISGPLLANLWQKIGDCHIWNFNFERLDPKTN
jgi:hypothetical protein